MDSSTVENDGERETYDEAEACRREAYEVYRRQCREQAETEWRWRYNVYGETPW